jgi:hypothetical protein
MGWDRGGGAKKSPGVSSPGFISSGVSRRARLEGLHLPRGAVGTVCSVSCRKIKGPSESSRSPSVKMDSVLDFDEPKAIVRLHPQHLHVSDGLELLLVSRCSYYVLRTATAPVMSCCLWVDHKIKSIFH